MGKKESDVSNWLITPESLRANVSAKISLPVEKNALTRTKSYDLISPPCKDERGGVVPRYEGIQKRRIEEEDEERKRTASLPNHASQNDDLPTQITAVKASRDDSKRTVSQHDEKITTCVYSYEKRK